jgi:hypothetical protein
MRGRQQQQGAWLLDGRAEAEVAVGGGRVGDEGALGGAVEVGASDTEKRAERLACPVAGSAPPFTGLHQPWRAWIQGRPRRQWNSRQPCTRLFVLLSATAIRLSFEEQPDAT